MDFDKENEIENDFFSNLENEKFRFVFRKFLNFRA